MDSFKKTIVLIPGHTQKQSGCYCEPPMACTEHMGAVDFVEALSKTLSEKFVTVIVFRDGKTIQETYAKVAEMKPDAAIECHFNAADDKSARGTETLCSSKNKFFAGCIQMAMVRALEREGKFNRGVKILDRQEQRGEHNVSNLNATNIPNCLIEPVFGSNTDDCKLFLDNETKLCSEIRDAFTQFFSGRLSD